MEPKDILKQLPRSTPAWAIGLVSILVSAVVSFGAVYVIVRPEVQKHLEETYKVSDRKATTESTVISSMLDLVRSYSDQISSLSLAVTKAQDNNTKLAERVTAIEKELAETRFSLVDCQDKLRLRK